MNLDGLTSWVKHIAGRQPFFPHQMSFILELPLRRLLVTPSGLADRLHLQPDAKVLEVGCGSGVFSVEVARRLPRGHLELFDLQQEMLDKARRKIDAAGLGRVVGYTQGDAGHLALPRGEFDVAFLVAVLGEVPEPRRCLRALHRVIRPGGLLSVTEHLPDPDFSWPSHLRGMVEQEGFEFLERFGPPWSYTANFRRPASSPSHGGIAHDSVRRRPR
jgi:ubiquinone/menaquinone biosynthesis C-methylase UbiE